MRKRGVVVACILVASSAACGSSRIANDGAGAGGAAGSSGSTGAPAAPLYTLTPLDGARITSKPDDPSYQKAHAEIDPTAAPFADAKLVVDLASTWFPFEQWKKDPPPAGQSWPASCDAFDRNFEVALFDPAAPAAPGIELVHAITRSAGRSTSSST